MTDKLKKVLEKARMVEQPRKEENCWYKSKNQLKATVGASKDEPIVIYNPDIVNSKYGEYPSAIYSNPKIQKPIATEPVRYLNISETKI